MFCVALGISCDTKTTKITHKKTQRQYGFTVENVLSKIILDYAINLFGIN